MVNNKVFLRAIAVVPQCFVCCSLAAAPAGYPEYVLDPVVIYPVKEETAPGEPAALRYRTIEMHSQTPGREAGEKLQRNAAIDVRRRGPAGVQADIQMRGASYEQTDIMVDGIRVNDPQTGHFNFDLPFFSEDIERISAYPGGTAVRMSSAAQGGVIHIDTVRPRIPGTEARITRGSNHYRAEHVSATYTTRQVISRTAFGGSSSAGYRPNTDFEQWGISHTSQLATGEGMLRGSIYALDKKFGAAGFYSEWYPNQWEHTRTVLAHVSWEEDASGQGMTTRAYLRRHADCFLLERDDPDFFKNQHVNYIAGFSVAANRQAGDGSWRLENDLAREAINSSNLGDHTRWRNTVHAQFYSGGDQFFFSLAAVALFRNDFGTTIVPRGHVGYWFQEALQGYAGFSQFVRFPTFTELYYQSPANTGNPSLSPEQAQQYEIGLIFLPPGWEWSLSGFHSRGSDMIDWVRPAAGTVYQADNIRRVTTRGLEATVYWTPSPARAEDSFACFAGYAYLWRSEAPSGMVSKYVFEYASVTATLGSSLPAPCDSMLSVFMRYRRPIEREAYGVWHARWQRDTGWFGVFVEIENIFNRRYEELRGIVLPGRSFYSGCSVRW